jgi:hypothetical protein
MGSLRARLIDRNRYSKRYPLIRAPKRLTYTGDEDLAMEVGSIYFDNTDSGSLTFEIPLPASYAVQAMAREEGSESADVNLYIKAGNLQAGQVTVHASAPFTGYVDILAIKVG